MCFKSDIKEKLKTFEIMIIDHFQKNFDNMSRQQFGLEWENYFSDALGGENIRGNHKMDIKVGNYGISLKTLTTSLTIQTKNRYLSWIESHHKIPNYIPNSKENFDYLINLISNRYQDSINTFNVMELNTLIVPWNLNYKKNELVFRVYYKKPFDFSKIDGYNHTDFKMVPIINGRVSRDFWMKFNPPGYPFGENRIYFHDMCLENDIVFETTISINKLKKEKRKMTNMDTKLYTMVRAICDAGKPEYLKYLNLEQSDMQFPIAVGNVKGSQSHRKGAPSIDNQIDNNKKIPVSCKPHVKTIMELTNLPITRIQNALVKVPPSANKSIRRNVVPDRNLIRSKCPQSLVSQLEPYLNK